MPTLPNDYNIRLNYVNMRYNHFDIQLNKAAVKRRIINYTDYDITQKVTPSEHKKIEITFEPYFGKIHFKIVPSDI